MWFKFVPVMHKKTQGLRNQCHVRVDDSPVAAAGEHTKRPYDESLQEGGGFHQRDSQEKEGRHLEAFLGAFR
jgi:hypothetical protein